MVQQRSSTPYLIARSVRNKRPQRCRREKPSLRNAALTGAVSLSITILGLAAIANRLLFVARVVGDSMEPSLRDGQHVLVLRGRRFITTGRIVVGHPPDMPSETRYIKRMIALGGEPEPSGSLVPKGHYWVEGDGRESADSRVWGAVAYESIEGVVIKVMR